MVTDCKKKQAEWYRRPAQWGERTEREHLSRVQERLGEREEESVCVRAPITRECAGRGGLGTVPGRRPWSAS